MNLTPQKEFYDALTRFKNGHEEPLHETVAVLAYEVGRMLENAMYAYWDETQRYDWDCKKGRIAFLQSELMDAIAQCVLICESIGVNFDELKEKGIEKAMERFTGKEVKK